MNKLYLSYFFWKLIIFVLFLKKANYIPHLIKFTSLKQKTLTQRLKPSSTVVWDFRTKEAPIDGRLSIVSNVCFDFDLENLVVCNLTFFTLIFDFGHGLRISGLFHFDFGIIQSRVCFDFEFWLWFRRWLTSSGFVDVNKFWVRFRIWNLI